MKKNDYSVTISEANDNMIASDEEIYRYLINKEANKIRNMKMQNHNKLMNTDPLCSMTCD